MGSPTTNLPVEQDRLDQGDDVPAGIISGTDDSHVDCLGSKGNKASSQMEEDLPGASQHMPRNTRPLFLVGIIRKQRAQSATVENNSTVLLRPF